MVRSHQEQGRHNSRAPIRGGGYRESFPRYLSSWPDFDRIVARGFYPNDRALQPPVQLYHERGHAFLDSVEDDRGSRGSRSHGDLLLPAPRQRRAAGRKQYARKSQDEKPCCVPSPHGRLAFAYECITAKRRVVKVLSILGRTLNVCLAEGVLGNGAVFNCLIILDMLNDYNDFAAGMSVFKISKGLGGLA